MKTAVITLALTTSLFLPTSAQKDDKKWDVAADLGPVTKLAFDTDEGTWMNVDVSPDGKRIVFDLLGDIYIMPDSSANNKSECSTGAAMRLPRAWQLTVMFVASGFSRP